MSLRIFHIAFVTVSAFLGYFVALMALYGPHGPDWLRCFLGFAGGVGLTIYGVMISRKFRQLPKNPA